AIAAGVLLAEDLPHPSNYSAEADRVLWTLVGVAIAVLVMLLGNLLAKRTPKARPQAAPHPA
ncbi:MAG: FUSC family protein, partial [Solirubrobacteraceae bacterium]